MKPESPVALCFDVGGTKISAALVDTDGTILVSTRRLFQTGRSPSGLVDHMQAMRAELTAALPGNALRVGGVGCSFAGIVDDRTGVVFKGTNLWPEADIPLGEMIAARFGCPVTVQMDASMAALGEHWQGSGRGCRNFALIIVGTGIGAGLVLNGELYVGSRGTAGELGHNRMIQDGPLCGCGRRGCLEALAGGLAIAAQGEQAARLPSAATLRKLASGRAVETADVFEAARQADPAALEVIRRAGGYLGQAVADLMHVLDLEAIALGGGVMEGGGDVLLPLVRAAAKEEAGSWIDWERVSIHLAELPSTAGLLGVAKMTWERCIRL